MDMIGPLPESKGYNAIFVIVDRLTKMAYFLPSQTNLMAKGAATLLRDQVFCKHGVPKKIISDRGPQFVSLFMKEFYKMWNIEHNASTAFHPQTDGQTERVNQEVKTFLTMFTKNDSQNWAEHLALAQFCYND